jgi:glycosyltransferase involved in cell wall biosynthesis
MLLTRELRARAPEQVYCTTTAACLAAPVARLAGVPHVIGHAQEILSRTDRVTLAPLFAGCQTRLAISASVRDSLPRIVRRSTTVVPNGTPPPETFTWLDGRSGGLRYLVASRWNGWKGHETLLRAWEIADAPGTLVVLGGPPLSGDRTDVPALVARLRRPESVQVVGEVSDPSPYVDQADVMIVPSERPEPFGLVAIEAFARARPVIASDAGGLREVVTPGTDGWLFEPGDAQALAALMTHITREQVTAAGRAARAAFEARFTEARWAEEWRSAVFSGCTGRT